MKGVFSVCIALAVLGLLAVDAGAENPKADLIWVVDGSMGMGRDGGAERIRGFISAMTALTSANLHRVGVLCYGGWAETQQAGLEAIAPAELPVPFSERVAWLAEFEKNLNEKLRFEHSAADMNAAFAQDGALLDKVRAWRESEGERPLIVAIVSPGAIDVIETLLVGDDVKVVARKEYVEGALRGSGDANRESVNAEGRRIFLETVAPALAQMPSARVIAFRTGLSVHPQKDVLPVLVGMEGMVDLNTVEISQASALLAGTFDRVGSGSFDQRLFQSALSDDGQDRLSTGVTVVPGTTGMALLLKGPLGFSAGLKSPDGRMASLGGDVFVFGGESEYRLYLYPAPDPGEHQLTAEYSEGAGTIGMAAFRRINYGLNFEIKNQPQPLYAGAQVDGRICVTWGSPPAVVVDPDTLGQMEITVTLTGPGGLSETERIGLASLSEGVLNVPLKLGEGGASGDVTVEARLRAFPLDEEGASFEFLSAPLTMTIPVLGGATEIEVQFDREDAFTGEEVGIVGKLVAGRAPEGSPRLTVQTQDGRESVDVTLFGGEEPGTYWGKVRLPSEGTWSPARRKWSSSECGIRSGGQGSLVVNARSVVLEVQKDGQFETPGSVEIPFLEKVPEGGIQGLPVFVRADLGVGETGRIKLGVDLNAKWKVRLFLGDEDITDDGLELTGDANRQEIRIVVEPDGNEPKEGVHSGGTLLPKLVLTGVGPAGGDLEIESKTDFDVKVVPGPPPWYMNPLIWAAAGGALLVLLVVIWVFTGSKFEYQHLVLQGEEGYGKAPFFFVDNATGFKKKKAHGTYELDESVLIKVKGGGECFISALSKDVEIRVNGRKISGSFHLREGNLVEITKGDRVLTYRYGITPVVPEDISDDEFVIMEYDEDDDFIIADDDEVPEYIPSEDPQPGLPKEEIPEVASHGWVDDEAATDDAAPQSESGLAAVTPGEFGQETLMDMSGEGLREALEQDGASGSAEETPSFSELVDERPADELVTATPLPMPEDGATQVQAGEEPQVDVDFDEAQTLMPMSKEDIQGFQPEKPSEETVPFDEDMTFVGVSPQPDETPETEPEATAEAAAEQEEIPFDDAMTLMGIKETGEITHAELEAAQADQATEQAQEAPQQDASGDDDEEDEARAVSMDEMESFFDLSADELKKAAQAEDARQDDVTFDEEATFVGDTSKIDGHDDVDGDTTQGDDEESGAKD